MVYIGGLGEVGGSTNKKSSNTSSSNGLTSNIGTAWVKPEPDSGYEDPNKLMSVGPALEWNNSLPDINSAWKQPDKTSLEAKIDTAIAPPSQNTGGLLGVDNDMFSGAVNKEGAYSTYLTDIYSQSQLSGLSGDDRAKAQERLDRTMSQVNGMSIAQRNQFLSNQLKGMDLSGLNTTGIRNEGVSDEEYDTSISAQLNAGTYAAEDTASDLGYDMDFKTPEEQAKADIDLRQLDYEDQLANMDYLDEKDRFELAQARERSDSLIEATSVAYATGREGAQSSTNQRLANEFAAAQKKQLDFMQKGLERSMQNRNIIREKIAAAKERGDFETVSAYNERLSLAEQNVQRQQQAAADLAQANLQISQDVQAANESKVESGISNFATFLTTGYEGSLENAIKIGADYGLNTDQSVNLYNGYKAIMDNNSLTQEQKAAETEQLTQEAKLQQQGYITEQQQSGKILYDQYKAGDLTLEQMEQAFQMGGIDSKYNPVAVAKMEYEKSKLQQAQIDLAGETPSAQEVTEYLANEVNFQNSLGQTQVLMPTASKFGVTGTQGGIVVNVTQDQQMDVKGTDRDEGQCGAFVNDVLGVGIGDLYTDKLALAKESIPKPGMAFVMETNTKYGHTGIVESINPDGTINIVESNWNDDGKITRRKNMSVGAFGGFINPSKSELTTVGINGDNGSSFSPSDVSTLNSFSGKEIPSEKQAQYDKFIETKNNPSTTIDTVLQLSQGSKELQTGQVETLGSFDSIITQLDSLDEALAKKSANKSAPIMGILSNANPWDTKAKEIKAIIQGTVPKAARGIFGEVGVLTDKDISRYEKLFPTLTDTKDQQDMLTDMMRTMLTNGMSKTLRNYASSGRDVSGYQYLIDSVSPSGGIAEEPAPADPNSTWNTYFSPEVMAEDTASTYFDKYGI